ncbi:hypothetical protein BD413DRAFT_612553 [Trametes elegans]|nr:hypothetical protein BD413DRAFT_612553 [Trametes elegans]
MSSGLDSHSHGLQHFIFSLSLFWAALYGLRHYRRRARRITPLPSFTSAAAGPASAELFRSPATRITLRKLHLRYQSTAWNALHQSSVARLAKRSGWRKMLQLVYDAGSVLGVLGMLSSMALLAWTTGQLSLSLYARSSYSTVPSPTSTVFKRSVAEDDGHVAQSASHPGGPALQLIVPGVTTPLHHLPLLLLALLITQVIHECGHAVAAALHALPLTSAGLSLTVLLPSAFVAFPTDETAALPARARARLAAAGAFHNLAFWLVLGVAAALRTSAFVWPMLGYRDVSSYGRVVVAVDEDSPLYGHVPVGAVIYKVGDEPLAAPEGAAARWEALMSPSAGKAQTSSLGWCADEPWFAAQDSACCIGASIDSGSDSSDASGPTRVCFAALNEPAFARCVDPLRFLHPAESAGARRCAARGECARGELCVRPRGDQDVLALTMHLPAWLQAAEAADAGGDGEVTVVWQGDRREILEEVDVGDWLPRARWLPMGLPFVWATLFSYLQTLTLSLYFFNLLPLPFLDGGQLLDVLADAWARVGRGRPGDEAIPLAGVEEGESAGGVTTSRARTGSVGARAESMTRWKKVVHVGAGVLTGACVVLSLVNTYF